MCKKCNNDIFCYCGQNVQKPDEVSESTLNDLLVRRLMRDNTKIEPVVMDECPDAHNVWLVVGVQSFCVTPAGTETKEEAVFIQKMLATALSNIVAEH